MGALVTFELFRILVTEKYPLPLLVVLSSSSPRPDDSILSSNDVVKTLHEKGWWMGDVSNTPTPVLLSDIRAYSTYVPKKIEGNLKCPCLLITAQNDKALSTSQLKQWKEFYTHVIDDIITIPQADHFYPLTHSLKLRRVLDMKIRELLSSRKISELSGPSFPSTYDMNNETIDSVILKTARRRASDVVIVDGKLELTHSQVVSRSISLACVIQSKLNHSAPHKIVAVYMPTSADWIVSALSILLAGAAIQPFYNTYTSDLMVDLAKECSLQAILTNQSFAKRIPSSLHHLIILVDDSSKSFDHNNDDNKYKPPKTNSSRLAYCAMTSGSTGKPKSIGCTHDALLRNFFLREMVIPRTNSEKPVCDACNLFFVWECLRGSFFLFLSLLHTHTHTHTHHTHRSFVWISYVIVVILSLSLSTTTTTIFPSHTNINNNNKVTPEHTYRYRCDSRRCRDRSKTTCLVLLSSQGHKSHVHTITTSKHIGLSKSQS